MTGRTRQEDHDRLLKVAKDIEFIRMKLEDGDTRFNLHSVRVDSLENSRSRLKGALTTILAIVTALGVERLIAYVRG